PASLQMATMAWRPAGPSPEAETPEGRELAEAGRVEDALIRARAPLDRADLLRGVGRADGALATRGGARRRRPGAVRARVRGGRILGASVGPAGGKHELWDEARQGEALAALAQAVALAPASYAARLFQGRALARASHAAQATLRTAEGALAREAGDGQLAA